MSYIESLFSLQGKTALIVGGHGLYGNALTDAFASSGVKTYIAARDVEALSCLARKYPHDRVLPLPVDLSSAESVEVLVNTLFSRESCIDILVNNAVARPMRSYNAPIEDFAQSMAINATGIFQLTRAVANRMATQNSGSIINIGSMQGMVGPDPFLYQDLDMDGLIPDYFYHKAGLINLTRFFASYYGRYGVRCNCISPGGVFTEMVPLEFVQRYAQHTMLGRMANPDDIVGLALFLASDAAQYVTGTNIPVDGGYTAK